MQPLIDEPISPELVLVDPELAQRVRAFAVAGRQLTADVEPDRAPAGTDTVQQAVGALSEAEVIVERDVEPLRQRIPAVLRRARLVEALALVSLVAFLGLALLPPRDAPHFAIPAEPGTASGRSSAIVAWSPRPGVDRYRVQLSYHGRVVYTATVGQASMRVPDWLRSGRYTWRVSEVGSGRGTARAPFEDGLVTVSR